MSLILLVWQRSALLECFCLLCFVLGIRKFWVVIRTFESELFLNRTFNSMFMKMTFGGSCSKSIAAAAREVCDVCL